MLQLNKESYLAGLFEGDGHISLSPDNSYNPRFNITFNSKDRDTALLIKTWLDGHGFIRNKVRENAIVYTISNIKGLLLVIDMINGKLRTPKIRQLHSCIDYLNKNSLSSPISLLPLDDSPIESNSWFAGFSDADGSFDIRYTDGLKKLRIASRFRIDQRKVDPISGESYEPIFTKISIFLGTKKVNYRNIKGREYLNVSASSVKSIKILKEYFNKHSLISSKYLNFKDWEKVSDMILNKEHFKNKEKVKLIKNGMNNLRTKVNFDHLSHIRFLSACIVLPKVAK